MNTISLWIPKCFYKLLIKLKIYTRFSKKRCIIFLSVYIFSIILLLLCLRDTFMMNNYENCTVHSNDILEMEKRFSQNADSYLKSLLKDSSMNNKLPDQKWTHIASNTYVYSAFIETCPLELLTPLQFCVKFVGITLSNLSSISPFLSTLKCAIRNHFVISKEEFAIIELLPEYHDLLFTSAFLFCPLKNIELTHASLYDDNFLNLTWIPVENNLLPPISKVNIFSHDSYFIKFSEGVNLCVRPFYDNFNSVQFSEFVSYYSAMGVDHFIFYYLKSFEPLNVLLQILKYTNISNEIFLWDIPLSNDLIHEFGQIAFTQDCIARSKNKFGHTLIIDLDEYIVPQVHKSIKSLASYLDESNPYAGSYIIPMALFCDEYAVQNSNASPFHILNHNRRQNTHWQHRFRSKYILKPDRIRYTGIHFTWKLEKNYKEVHVLPNIAQLNHYRSCCGMFQTWFLHLFEFKVLNDKIVVDNSLINHKIKFMNNNLIKFFSNILFENTL